MDNEKLTPFHIIGHDIKVALDNRAFTGALILVYAAIDAMAFLSMQESQKEVHRKDFINWVEKYMKTDSKQPYQYQGIDLYSARCGIVHRYGATSRLSDIGQCKIFNYHNGSEHIYKPTVHEDLVAISWHRFINYLGVSPLSGQKIGFFKVYFVPALNDFIVSTILSKKTKL